MKNKRISNLILLSALSVATMMSCNSNKSDIPSAKSIGTSETSASKINKDEESKNSPKSDSTKPSTSVTQPKSDTCTPSISRPSTDSTKPSDSTPSIKKEVVVTLQGMGEVVEGKTIQLTATVENAENTSVTWSSEDETVATVSDGLVTALKTGNTKIRATSVEDDTKYAEMTVVVVSRFAFEVTENKEYVVEGENLDLSNAILRQDLQAAGLGFIEEPTGGSKDKTSNGKCIRGVATGSKLGFAFKMDKKSRIQIVATLANYEEGFDLDSNVNFALDDAKLLSNAVFGGHSVPDDYWPWQDITLADVLVDEGEHTFTINVTGSLPNLDCFKFVVSDYDDTDKYLSISQDGNIIVDVETLNLDGWVLREDLAAAGRTKESMIETATDAYNGKSIGGIGKGSIFEVSFYLDDEAFVKPYARMADYGDVFDVDSNIKFTMDNTLVTSNGYTSFGHTDQNQFWNWKDVALTEMKLKKGFHTFRYEAINNGINLDAFILETSYYGRTDEKGFQIEGNGKLTVEAETIKVSGGSYTVETPTGDSSSITSGGKSIGNIVSGTIFSIPFFVKEECDIDIIGAMAKYEDVFSLDDNLEIKIDDEVVTTGYSAFGHTDNNQYWNWKQVKLVSRRFEKGNHTFEMKVKNQCPNIDCFYLDVTGYNDLLNISKNGTYLYEGENLPTDHMNFDAAGISGRVESDSRSSGGKSLGHLASGSYFDFPFYLQGNATLDLTLVLSKYEAISLKDYKLYMDGIEIAFENPEMQLGRKEDGSNDWFNWKDCKVVSQALAKGEHVFRFSLPGNVCNIDCLKFVISDFAA